MATKAKVKNKQERAAGTREALMREGIRLFAKHGFEAASVREICKAAKANVAAVAYYFGGKQGLYDAILQDWFQTEKQLFPSPSLYESASAEAFLEDLIFVILSRMHRISLSPWAALMVRREMMFPSKSFRKFVDEIIATDFALFFQALRLLAPEAPEDKVRHAVLCLSGQVGAYTAHPKDFLQLGFPDLVFNGEACRRIARVIVHFAVSGLQTPLPAESAS